MPKDDDLPHIDAVSGQAAWSLVQILAMHLVKGGVLRREDVEEGIDASVRHYAAPGANPAQKASSVLLQQFRDMLQTADRSSAH